MELIVIGFIIWAIVSWYQSQEGPNTSDVGPLDQGIRLRTLPDVFTADDGTSLPVALVLATGSFEVPRDGHPVVIQARIADITEGEKEMMPVLCSVPDLADEDGVYAVDELIDVPHQFASIEDYNICVLPLPELIAPRRGKRRLRVFVAVADSFDLDRAFAQSFVDMTYDQASLGYLEIGDYLRACEKHIASLALAVAASDGHLDHAEVGTIKNFFTARYEGQEDAEELKSGASNTLRTTLQRLQSDPASAGLLIDSACEQLASEHAFGMRQQAYELCVQVVASDGRIDPAEQTALVKVASRLQLPDEFVREAHDRFIRISMFDGASDEVVIGMPIDLSEEEKLDFLTSEYRKWRKRATHSDSEIVAEATERLERIARLRRRLTHGEAGYSQPQAR